VGRHQNHRPAGRQRSILVRAWLSTITALEALLGANPAEWQWGHVHTLEHIHALGRKKPLDLVFNVGPFPAAGSREVINQQAFLYATGLKRVRNGPSTRRVIDFADPEHALGINPTWQSGYLWDRHYDDQSELFHTGRLRS
jgi:penicillin amidase